ncbi:hypothetical protein EFE32_08060 [Lactococcus lactis subsp. lactis]|nr:hypothetical protein [Lactococcus lactis subsp. lactis]
MKVRQNKCKEDRGIAGDLGYILGAIVSIVVAVYVIVLLQRIEKIHVNKKGQCPFFLLLKLRTKNQGIIRE